jgi:hypothetical protein
MAEVQKVPTSDWAPPDRGREAEEERLQRGTQGDGHSMTMSAGEVKQVTDEAAEPSDIVSHKAKDEAIADVARRTSRLIRADLKKLFDAKRMLGKQTERPRRAENSRIVTVKVALDDRNGVTPHLVHGRSIEFEFGATKTPFQFRKKLVPRLRLKGIIWSLERLSRESGRYEWYELAHGVKLKEGEMFRVTVLKTRARKPNSPGTTKRMKFERANQREKRRLSLKSYLWEPGYGRKVEVSTEIRSPEDPPPCLGAWGPGHRRRRIEHEVVPPPLPGYEEEAMSAEQLAETRNQERENKLKWIEKARTELERLEAAKAVEEERREAIRDQKQAAYDRRKTKPAVPEGLPPDVEKKKKKQNWEKRQNPIDKQTRSDHVRQTKQPHKCD